MTTTNDTINQFIINVSLVNPIEKIVNKLNNREFRDCDVKWLDQKLFGFIDFAAKTLGINYLTNIPKESFPVMNDHNYEYYLKYFNQLLKYFRSL